MSFDKNTITNEQKEMAIAQAMETSEGRQVLAQAMVEPIRRALEFQAIGRKLLMVDELPQGALPRYERDVTSTAWVVSRRGAVADHITEAEEILVPTFEIAVNPTVRLAEINARRFFIVDRAQIKAKEAIQKIEDKQIFDALSAAVRADQTTSVATNLDADTINEGMRFVEEHDLVAAKIIMHARRYADLRMFGKEFFDEATQREIITTGLYGHIFTADIHVSSKMDPDEVLVVATPETVGAFPIKQDITVLPADDPKKLRLGWIIYEEIGIVIVNDYAVSKITVT